MKILKIRLKNIQSLYGEHEIDFTKDSFIESSLFLIIGDTGGGKTSILDAVTLALYDRITRYGSDKGKNLAESVMSRNTTECFAEVLFEVNGKHYKSRWESDRRSKRKLDARNEATDPKMTFINMEDNTNNKGQKKSEVLEEIKKITKLDFEQFLRSVMLAQGEFTKFLKAKPNERAELLEKMTGTEIYQQISKKTFEKHKHEKENLEKLNLQIEQIRVLSTEELEAINLEKNNIQEQIKTLETEIERIDSQIIALQNIEKINQEITTLQEQEKQLKEQITALAPQTEALGWHEKAIEYEKELSEINRLQKEITQQQQKLQTTQTELKRYSEEVQEAQYTLNFQSEAYQQFKNEKSEKEKIISEKLIPLEVEKKQSIQETAVLENELQTFETELKNLIKKNNIPYRFATSLQEAEKKIRENTKKLQIVEQEIQTQKDINLQEKQKIAYNERLHLQKWQSKAQNLQEKQAELEKKKTENQIDKEKLKQAQIQWEQDSSQIAHLKTEISLLRTIVEQEKLIANYEKQRRHLEAGKPCPLCGSVHHPFAENLPPSQLSEHEKQLQNLQKNLENLQNQVEQNPKNILETLISQKNETISQLQRDIEQIKQTLLAERIEIENLPLQMAENDQKCKEIETEIERVQNLEKRLTYLQNEGLLTEKDQEIWEKKNYLTQKRKRLSEIEQSIASISPEGKAASLIGEELRAKEAELFTNLEISREKLHDLQKKQQIANQNILFYQEEVAQNQGEYELALANILPKIAQKGFTSLIDLQAKILPQDLAQKYRQEQEKLQSNLKQVQTLLNSKKNEANSINSKLHQDTLKDLNTLQNQKQEVLSQRDELLVKIGKIEEQIKQNETGKTERKALLSKVEKQKQEVERWEKLNKLIGSEDGSRFRKFAQSLTLQKLVLLANSHLKNFNKRYLICKAEAKENSKKVEKEGLGLEIMDREQADEIRPVESLSGGESFLVSLSLALGLSDLASKNVQIDTLFIDEGFGTLDENTLDTAIEVLETLQHTGKTIGIISHVKALKERIKQQIKVKKIGAGRSTIELPY